MRKRILGIAVIGQVFTMAITASAMIGFAQMSSTATETATVSEAQRYFQDGDMMHDALRGDAHRTVLAVVQHRPAAELAAIAKDTADDAARFRKDIESIAGLNLDAHAARALASVRTRLESYITGAEEIARRAGADTAWAATALGPFEVRFRDAEAAQDGVLRAIEARRAEQATLTASTRHATLVRLALGGIASFLGLIVLTWWLGRSIVVSLNRLGAVAGRVVAGDLRARANVDSRDEIGVLAAKFNEMADSLTGFVDRLEADAQRDGFGSQLVEALEMADEEDAAHEVIERAMVEVARSAPMELLLSDSSKASLEPAAASPTAGAPGCPVQSPFSCVAVRRGNPVVFEDSEALSACPKLRGRASGPCSAVCVPVTFMGRALGVLHATGPVGEPLRAEQVAQLTTLVTQSGARIGTVRAFEKTQLQASTDGLTGLINRRTLENEVRQLMSHGRRFALAMADLDRFKSLNDTHGHEAGDRALRLFSQVVRGVVGEGDLAARFGGEEFVLVLPDADAAAAVAFCERLRAELAQAHTGDHPRFTGSFGVTDSTQADTLEALLRIADAGLYAAKEGGRDQVVHSGGSRIESDAAEALVTAEVARATRPLARTPAIHTASQEEDARPSGVQIR